MRECWSSDVTMKGASSLSKRGELKIIKEKVQEEQEEMRKLKYDRTHCFIYNWKSSTSSFSNY